ncbi:hypothetical protein TanjilG_21984 [Lupinus angustifolius]|uniref:Uncharacterized protein n=1 Tax=Lupinus angustifolius TaxID=3871 RepID=A0A394DBQ4_LUPAN|nr:hypothetical protein TanjilG_21984 [Lupinus angustifolius]
MGLLHLVDEVKEHLDLFKKAGAITTIFCNQYLSADEEIKNILENFIWEYYEDSYLRVWKKLQNLLFLWL